MDDIAIFYFNYSVLNEYQLPSWAVLVHPYEILTRNHRFWVPVLELKTGGPGSSHSGGAETNPTRMRVGSLASLNGLRIQHCRELWCRSQTWLGSCVAVAVVMAGSFRSADSTPILGTCICCRSGLKKKGKKCGPERLRHFTKVTQLAGRTM